MSDAARPPEGASDPDEVVDADSPVAPSTADTEELAAAAPQGDAATVMRTVPEVPGETQDGATVVRSVPAESTVLPVPSAVAQPPVVSEPPAAAEPAGAQESVAGGALGAAAIGDAATVEVHEPIIATGEEPPADAPHVSELADVQPSVVAQGFERREQAAPAVDSETTFVPSHTGAPSGFAADPGAGDGGSPLAILSERPELLVGAAFAAGLLIAVVLKRRGS